MTYSFLHILLCCESETWERCWRCLFVKIKGDVNLSKKNWKIHTPFNFHTPWAPNKFILMSRYLLPPDSVFFLSLPLTKFPLKKRGKTQSGRRGGKDGRPCPCQCGGRDVVKHPPHSQSTIYNGTGSFMFTHTLRHLISSSPFSLMSQLIVPIFTHTHRHPFFTVWIF
jgi:hypothetical protein